MSITDELYDFQRRAVDFAVERPGVALFCEQGTGKTHIAAGIIERLCVARRFSGLCVVPLANIETTWADLLSRIDGLTICRTWAEFKKAGKVICNRLLLLHYEGVKGKLVRKLGKQPWSLVVYDESQRIKARGSKQSKASSRFKCVDHRVILSGTPVEQSPQDLWAQFRFALPDVLGTRWADFDAQWLKPCGFMGYDREFLWKKLPEFLDLIRPHVLRVTKAEVLNLPPLTYHREVVPLLGEQARVYHDLDREMVAVLVDGREIVCDMRITQVVRLQQAVGGFVRTEDGESVSIGRAKARRLGVVLRREQLPIVIFCKYREEVEICGDVARTLCGGKVRVGFITGKNRKTRAETIRAFQLSEIDVLVCQVKAGGVGINLFNSCTGVFYSATFSYIDFDQAVSRLHRHGQTSPVRFILLQAENSVDTIIYSALLLKRNVSEQVLEDNSKKRKATTMAKKAEAPKTEAKTEAKAEKAKPTPPPQPPKPKYGVPELAEVMGVKASSVRVKLRSAGIEKSGKLYGWDSKAEMMEIVGKLKANAGKKNGKKEAEPEDEEESEDE